jgi:SAM-dependent methyltransferase
MKDVFPEITTSDILELEDNDLTFNALDMPFDDNSISAFVMVDVFHHVPHSEKFLSEMQRCLKPGGKIVMSEPCVSTWAKFIFTRFHHEPFNVEGDWTIPGSGPMSDANGALPWIVFERDYQRFASSFTQLELIEIKHHTPLRYLLSGGVSMIQLVPSWSFAFLKGIERFFQIFNKRFALFQFIEVKKKA